MGVLRFTGIPHYFFTFFFSWGFDSDERKQREEIAIITRGTPETVSSVDYYRSTTDLQNVLQYGREYERVISILWNAVD